MEIHFCDLCNESVPAADLKSGRAFLRKGRVVCAACDRAMGGGEAEGAAGPRASGGGGDYGRPGSGGAGGGGGSGGNVATLAPPTLPATRVASPPAASAEAPARAAETPAERGGGVLLGVVAVLFSAGSYALISQRLGEESAHNRDEVAQAWQELTALERRLGERFDGLAASLAKSESRTEASLARTRDELGGRIDELGREVGLLTERAAELRDDLDTLSREVGLDRKDVESRLTKLGDTQQSFLAAMNEWQRMLEQRVIAVEEYQRASLAGAPLPGASPAGPAGRPTWHGLLADLQHAHEGIRLETVYALGETGDAAVVPHLIPVLKDDNLFVRMATIQTLKNLGAREAVPNLIDALEDEESAVREVAVTALRQLTGREFRFEPLASPAERAKRVKAWRDWWEKSGDTFLES